ncbi:MAG: hypothetical protein ACREVG_07675, partial [Burkholderiales bacterium]
MAAGNVGNRTSHAHQHGPKPTPPHIPSTKRHHVLPADGPIGAHAVTLDDLGLSRPEPASPEVLSEIQQLFTDLASFADDPLGFVMWAFPWGVKGTSLENKKGPESWQKDQLRRLALRLQEANGLGCVIEEDIASGHGIGKSAEVAWVILWAISTFEDTRGVVTANTDTQLRTKTWAELSKWYQMFVGKSLFTLTATAIYAKGDDDKEKSWRIDQIPWTKEKSEAFAGLHNQGKRILVIFDEAAAIDDLIYDVTEGALTDAETEILWLRYGNPTRTTGRFFKNCLAAGTPVLTHQGWVPIEKVTADLLVWDGVDWVNQKGTQMSGRLSTMSVFGVRMTPDHKVLTMEGWRSGSTCQGHHRAQVRIPDGCEVCRSAQTGRSLGTGLRVRRDKAAPERGHPQEHSTSTPSLLRLQVPTRRDPRETTEPRDVAPSGLQRLGFDEGSVHEVVASSVAKLRWARDQCLRTMVGFLRSVLGGYGTGLRFWAYAGAQEERPAER